ncbi:MAG: hypothetical protein IPM57_06375 [Oligoflexia bacterium]|nr:hypothetical protein [Oligoflexia bacterium]
MKSVETQLKDVFSNPTAPYREGWVLNYIKSELKRLKYPYFQDNWGNIIAGSSQIKTLKLSKRIALVAHTDHPGFHILKQLNKDTFLVKWHGGYPPRVKGSSLAIYNPQFKNKISKAKALTNIDKKGYLKIKIIKSNFKISTQCFGAFDFKDYIKIKNLIKTRVADDLAGVTIILSTLERLNIKQRENFLGIFTTAEETGFKGALGLLYNKTLGLKNMAISLEASRQMKDALIGKGPVIRLGDRKSIFNFRVINKIDASALSLKNKIKYQRRIMSGGTCEATAFNMLGINCGGMAVPLGNYHNQRKNGKPGPEIINLKDVENAVKILVRLYAFEAKGSDPTEKFIKHLKNEFNKSKKYFNKRIKYE